jgi:hypothetical protein
MDLHISPPTSIYSYESLTDVDTIRLMYLEPALDSNSPLRFSFIQGSVSDLVAKYEAISYTWGEALTEYPLFVDDTHVSITKNLDQALRSLRLPLTKRALWADAVCINQMDKHEKAQQIPLMAKIFRGASKVLAWLNGSAEAERGLGLLDSLSRELTRNPDETSNQLLTRWSPQYDQDVKLDLIHKFLGLAWFGRVWIVQEIVMNVDAMLICGISEISWLRLAIAIDYLSGRFGDQSMQRKLDALQVIVALWKYHNRIDKHQGLSAVKHLSTGSVHDEGMLGIVDMLSSCGCTDDRDRIFALYNLAPDIQDGQSLKVQEGSQSTKGSYDLEYDRWQRNVPTQRLCEFPSLNICMSISYSSTTQQLYQEFAIACIEKARVASVLNAVLARQYTPCPPGWPSWVPDWRKPPTRVYIPLNDSVVCKPLTRNIIALLPRYTRTGFDKFMVVYHVITVPETSDGLLSLLRGKRRKWSPLNLKLIIEDLLYGQDDVEVAALTNYLLVDDTNITTEPTCELIRAMSGVLHAALRNRCFFEVKSPAEVPIVGHGSAAILPCDKLFPLQQMDWCYRKSRDDPQALVVRRVTADVEHEGKPIMTHRLIGSAYFTGALKHEAYKGSWNPKTWTKLYLV